MVNAFLMSTVPDYTAIISPLAAAVIGLIAGIASARINAKKDERGQDVVSVSSAFATVSQSEQALRKDFRELADQLATVRKEHGQLLADQGRLLERVETLEGDVRQLTGERDGIKASLATALQETEDFRRALRIAEQEAEEYRLAFDAAMLMLDCVIFNKGDEGLLAVASEHIKSAVMLERATRAAAPIDPALALEVLKLKGMKS